MLEILYENDSLLVCLKPPGILSSSDTRQEGSMPRLLEEHLGEGAYIGPVHRLDRETGGVMVYAKTGEAAAALSSSLAAGGHKKYLAIVQGRMEEPEGEMKDLLFRDAGKNKSFVVKRMRKGVREARLCYRVLEEKQQNGAWLSLVLVTLFTGRTHQIRVQFASRRHPVLGDRRYGGAENKQLMLWSAYLVFPDPETGKELSFYAAPQGDAWRIFQKISEM